ncbi:MAG: hypothetical protein ABI467_13905 [Kofleriaceae bacterium]
MADQDLTLHILGELRGEVRAFRQDTTRQLGELRGEVGELRGEVGELRIAVLGLGDRVDVTNQRLEVIEHTMVDYGTQLVLLGRFAKNTTSRQGDEVARHGDEIADLRTRVEKLEAKD